MFGNWKMHTTVQEAVALAGRIEDGLEDQYQGEHGLPTVALFPPVIALTAVGDVIDERTLRLGAQNCHWESHGPYTGEVSADMLKGLAEYVLVGHPDRRAMGETGDQIARKLSAAAESGLTPVLCVGEQEQGDLEKEVPKQLSDGLAAMEQTPRMLIAYEPRWALNGEHPAEASLIEDAVGLIKAKFPETPVLYGGSINENTVEGVLKTPELDGVVVGSASLSDKHFLGIVSQVARA